MSAELDERVVCPLCQAAALSRTALYNASLWRPARCGGYGAVVRIRWWLRGIPGGVAGLIVGAAVASVLLRSWLPLVAWFVLLVGAHWLVWLYLPRFLVARMDADAKR